MQAKVVRNWVSFACYAHIGHRPSINNNPPSSSLYFARKKKVSTALTLLDLLLDATLQALRLGGARPPARDRAVLGDEELLKVPLDALQAHDAGLALLHPLPHGLDLVAVDVRLAEHGERDAVVDHAEVLDLVVAARVLAAELVAGEAEELDVVGVLALQLFVELLKTLELRGEAAFAGGVDDQHDLALQVLQRVRLTLLVVGLEVVEGGSGRHVGKLSGGSGGGEERCIGSRSRLLEQAGKSETSGWEGGG